MPERYFRFTYCSANQSISARTRDRNNFDPFYYVCACVYAYVKVVFTAKNLEVVCLQCLPRYGKPAGFKFPNIIIIALPQAGLNNKKNNL